MSTTRLYMSMTDALTMTITGCLPAGNYYHLPFLPGDNFVHAMPFNPEPVLVLPAVGLPEDAEHGQDENFQIQGLPVDFVEVPTIWLNLLLRLN